MATAVGIMDREGWDHRTDILVVVNPKKSEVLWIPRDLYCKTIDHRINHAFQKGGHDLLKVCLAEHGFTVEHTVGVLRSTVERAFLEYKIVVPVPESQQFLYPLSPQQAIEEGSKVVRFDPPQELLVGERFHQWLGARVPMGGSIDATPDLVRLQRQQVLLRRLLEEKFDFESLAREGISASSAEAFQDLACVRPDWKFYTLEGVAPVTIRKMFVFVRSPSQQAIGA